MIGSHGEKVYCIAFFIGEVGAGTIMRNLKALSVGAWMLIGSVSAAADSAEVIAELRGMAFALDPAEIGISRENFTHPVWGMVMETGFADGFFTLVTLADGSTSLYFSSGGGMLGAGEFASVRRAVGHYLSGAQYFFDRAEPVVEYPRPAPGLVTFYFLAFDGVFAYSASESRLGVGEDELSNLFYAAHGVIDEIRKVNESKK